MEVLIMEVNNNLDIEEIIKTSKEVSTKIPDIELRYSEGIPISDNLRKLSTFEKKI